MTSIETNLDHEDKKFLSILSKYYAKEYTAQDVNKAYNVFSEAIEYYRS